MLGLGNRRTAVFNGFKKIVKSGLQLFYKADRTQAPLGEEQIRNNSFDELGIDKVTDGDFPLGTSAWSPSASGITFGDGFVDIDRAASSSDAYILQDILEVGKIYQVTFSAVITTGTLFLGVNDNRKIFGEGEYTNETFTLNVIAGFNPNLFIIRTSDTNTTIDARITNVSVKQLDPNNRWTVGPSTAIATFGEGFVDIFKETGAGSTDAFIYQDILENNKKYQVTFSGVITTGTLFFGTNAVDTNEFAAGTYENERFNFTTTSTDNFIIRNPNTGTKIDARITNVSVRAITNSIKDNSINSNDGTLYSGKALEFDGTGDKVVLNDANLTGEFAVCTWVKPTSFTECVIFGDDANEDWIRLQSATSITIKIANSSTNYISLTHGGNIAQDEWSRLIVTRGPDNILRFGINGVFYYPTTNTLGGTFNFNRLGIKDTQEITGALADVQVYDKAWNDTDVKYDWGNPDKDVFDRVGEAQVLGEEEVVNTDFATPQSDWSFANGWGLNGNTAVYDGAGAQYAKLVQPLTTVAGSTYQVTFTLNEISNSSVKIGLATSANSFLPDAAQFTAPGTHTITMRATASDNRIVLQVNSATMTCTVSNVSVQEVTTHASHILPTDCKSLLRLNEGAGDRVYDAAPVLGSEKVTNGDFATASGWGGLGANSWSISSGKARADYASPPVHPPSIEQAIGTEAGKTYKISFKVSDYVSGSVKVLLGYGSSPELSLDAAANGVYELITTPNDTNPQKIYISIKDSITELSIDNISVKEIKQAESFFITGTKNFLHQQPHIPQYAMSSFSKKMVFDGSNDHVACGSDASIDDIFTGGGTVSFWISPETDGGQNFGTIIGKGTVSIRVKDDDNEGVILNLGKGFSGDNADFLTSDEVVLENKMNHIAITYNDSSVSNTPLFYVNGVLKAIDTGSSTTPTGSASTDASPNLIIGNVSAGGSRSFDGIIDEVSLFDVELTQDEVVELFNSGSSYDSTTHSQSSNLNAYWRNNGAAQWDDLSTNTNHGTVSGSPTEIFLQEVPFFGKDSLGMFMNKPKLGGLNLNASGYVGIEDNNDLDFGTGAFTMECWVIANFTAQGSEAVNIILSLGGNVATEGTAGLGIKGSTGKIRGYVNSEVCDMNDTFTTGQWYHVVTTRAENGLCTLYLDAVAQTDTETTTGNVSNSHSKFIGKDTDAERFYDGVIDDVKLYNKALTAAEVTKNYNATKGKHKN